MIKTAIRVNPTDYDVNCIGIDSDIKEIYIKNTNHDKQPNEDHHLDSWIVDEVYEIQNSNNTLPIFSTQNDVYDQFNNWITTSNSTLLYCIALGGKATGKTYTLFGENSSKNQGLIPRFIRSLFDSETDTLLVQISMFLSYSDYFIDLLDPPTKHVYANNIGYSPSVGAFLLPLKSILSSTLEHSLHTLHVGLMSASMISLNSHDLFNSCHLITSCRIVTSQRTYTLTFIELSSTIFYPTCLTESDRLSSSCLEINCANSLAFCGLFGESGKDDINGFNSKSNQSIRKSLHITGPYETSFLTYFLQDAFSLRSPAHLSESQQPSTYLVGCLKSSTSCLSDTKVSLDFIHSISEKIQSNRKQHRETIQHQDSNEELNMNTTAAKPISYKPITDIIDEINQEIEKLSQLLEEFEAEKQALSENPTQSKSTLHSHLNTLETLKSFHEHKISYLLSYKDILARPYHFRNNFSHLGIEEIISIQKWLKSRGLLGIRYLPSANDEENEIKSKSAHQNLHHDDSHQIPWSGPIIPMTDPYLRPISSQNISCNYLHIPIPAGHMAFCFASLRQNIHQETIALSFPGIKHCKIFKLDGYLIRPKHCIIFRLGSNIKIRPLPNEDEEIVIVKVNGREISEETKLFNLDTITLGLDTIFVVHIPVNMDEETINPPQSTKQNKDELDLDNVFTPSIILTNILTNNDNLMKDDWCHSIVSGMQGDILSFASTHLMNINHYNHSALDRQLIPILKVSELTNDMKLLQYAPPISLVQKTLSTLSPTHLCVLTELHIAVKQINYLAHELRRLVTYEIILTKSSQTKQTSLVLRQYCGIEEGITLGGEVYTVHIRCEVLDGTKKSSKGDSWLWSTIIFIQRYFQIKKMYMDYHEKYESNLELLDEFYPPEIDPFYDPSLPELIGVSTLHIDSLYYLIDTRDTLPIITFKGNHGGQLKLHVRIWIDKVETVPSYITVDKESKLVDFMGHMAIIRFYFEYLLDIPPTISNDLQVIFSFFGHTGQYRTTRSPAMNIITGDKHAYINSIIVIEQKITPDFVRYIQKKSIEFEIWGTRLSNRQYIPASTMIGKLIRVGEPIRMKKVMKYCF